MTEPRGVAGGAWVALAGLLCAATLLARSVEPTAIDWQPSLAATQPWRAYTAVAVHYSGLHLGANLAGAVLVGALGPAARLPWRCAVAWLVAWPLTQIGLLVQPRLLHYGGLSGVLHAGVAVAAVHLIFSGRRAQRCIGIAMGLVLGGKVLGESPWGEPLRHPAGWDIAVAPVAHACGLLAGAACALAAECGQRYRTSRSHFHD